MSAEVFAFPPRRSEVELERSKRLGAAHPAAPGDFVALCISVAPECWTVFPVAGVDVCGRIETVRLACGLAATRRRVAVLDEAVVIGAQKYVGVEKLCHRAFDDLAEVIAAVRPLHVWAEPSPEAP